MFHMLTVANGTLFDTLQMSLFLISGTVNDLACVSWLNMYRNQCRCVSHLHSQNIWWRRELSELLLLWCSQCGINRKPNVNILSVCHT